MLIDLSCPVENRGISVRSNSETGEHYILLKLFNISEKVITSLNLNVKAFDENGAEIASLPVELTELHAESKELFAENKAISIEEIPDAKNFVVEFTYATFEDEEEPYEPSEENTVDYDDSEASLNDALALRELIPYAVRYASEHDDHWVCVCGRPNFLDSENCVRCGNSKDKMLEGFSSKSALNQTIKRQEEEAEEEARKDEERRKIKKKKIIKALIISGIVVVALAVVSVAAFFINNALINSEADKAAKNGDYLKAYELYDKTGNHKKMDEIQQYVMGNTPENLLLSLGSMAEDSENIYFIAYSNSYPYTNNLIKENKETKEKTILTDAASNCLNVLGDYIYFINSESKPCKMKKDGSTTEVIMETPIDYLCIIGNNMYYIRTDYNNPDNLTEEQCQTLAAQGQIESYKRLHKMNLKSKKDSLVSEEEMLTCAIYGDRIYFLSYNSTDYYSYALLKSINLDGSDLVTHIDVPVRSFVVKGEYLYYVPLYENGYQNMTEFNPAYLGYCVKRLNLTTNEIVTISSENDYVDWVCVSGEKVIYITYNRAEYIAANYSEEGYPSTNLVPNIVAYDLDTEQTTILATCPSTYLNVCGDEIYSISAYLSCRFKNDASDFDAVYADGTSNPPESEEVELTPDLESLY